MVSCSPELLGHFLTTGAVIRASFMRITWSPTVRIRTSVRKTRRWHRAVIQHVSACGSSSSSDGRGEEQKKQKRLNDMFVRRGSFACNKVQLSGPGWARFCSSRLLGNVAQGNLKVDNLSLTFLCRKQKKCSHTHVHFAPQYSHTLPTVKFKNFEYFQGKVSNFSRKTINKSLSCY